jgi:hypothetical protein
MPMTSLSQIVYTITASDTTAPTVHLISPANGTLTKTAAQIFSCNITNIEIANLTLQIWNSTSSNIYANTTALTGIFNQTNWTFALPYDDIFKWNCLGYDTNGNSNWSSEGNYTITLDTIAPYIAFVSPLNTTYAVSNITTNISTSGAQAIWWYNGSANETYTGAVIRTYNDGQYTLIAYANDSAGNLNATSRTFAVDTVPPIITIYSPLNQTYNNATILINFSADSYTNLWFYNESTNVSYTTLTYANVGEGSHTFIFYANDSAGNLNATSCQSYMVV